MKIKEIKKGVNVFSFTFKISWHIKTDGVSGSLLLRDVSVLSFKQWELCVTLKNKRV